MFYTPRILSFLGSLCLIYTSAFGQFEADFQRIHYGFQSVDHLSSVNLNNTGQQDLLLGSDGRLAWFIWENGTFPYFYKAILENSQDLEIIQTADFDQNGFIDPISIAKVGNNYRCFWYRNLNANLSGKKLLAQVSEPVLDFAILDLDKDGMQDLLLLSDRLWWYRHTDNNGTLEDPVELLGPDLELKSIDLIDGNGDEELDLLVRSEQEIYWVPWLSPAALFDTPELLHTTPEPIGNLQLVDLNADAHLDISWQAASGNELAWLENTGIGFGPSNALAGTGMNSFLHQWADVNGDQLLDLLWQNDQEEWYWQERNDLAFSTPQLLSAPALLESGNLVTTNVDGDTTPDFLQVRADFQGGTEVWWYEYDILADSVLAVQAILFGLQTVTGMEAHDFDLDSDQDMVLTVQRSLDDSLGYRLFYERKGTNTFSLRKAEQLEAGQLAFTATIDLDLDGLPDLVSRNEDAFFWQPNLGDWNFGTAEILPDWSSAPRFVDLNSDGQRDALSYNDSTIFWSEQIGGGVFLEEVPLLDLPAGLEGVGAPIVVDRDQDEDMDIGWSARSADSVYFFWANNPLVNGTDWLVEFAIALPTNTGQVYPAAWTMEAAMDYLLVWENGDDLEYAAYQCLDGSCTQIGAGQIGTLVRDYSVGDLDGDGLTDVVWASHNNAAAAFLGYRIWNSTDISFQEEESISPFLPLPESLQYSDVDGDRTPDLLVSGQRGDVHAFLSTLTNASFTSASVSGQIFWDINNSGTWEPDTEASLEWIPVELDTGERLAYSNEQGKYRHYLNPGNYEVAPQANADWDLSSQPLSYLFNLQSDPILGFDFGLTDNPTEQGLFWGLVLESHLCGATVHGSIQLYNARSTIAAGQIVVTFPNEMTIVSLGLSPDLIEGNTYTWNLQNLNPAQRFLIPIEVQIPEDTPENPFYSIRGALLFEESPGIPVTDSLFYDFRSNCNPAPVDLLVDPHPVNQGPYLFPGETLRYTMRFSVPTDEHPQQIVLVNILDPDLDWTSFQPLAASHLHQLSIDRASGLVTCVFEDTEAIQMDGYGYFTFTIKPKNDLPENTSITQQGGVIFDTNPPLATNLTEHFVVTEIPVLHTSDLLSPSSKLHWYPIPTDGPLFIEGLEEGASYEFILFDLLGRKLQAFPIIGDSSTLLPFNGLKGGIYRGQLYRAGRLVDEQFIQVYP